MRFADSPDSERAVAVSAFDARFGGMERVLWCLSVSSRAALLAGESSPVLESLVRTIKSWWGVQGRPLGDEGSDGQGSGRVDDLVAGPI